MIHKRQDSPRANASLGPSHRTWILDACGIFLLAAALIWPLFSLEYLNNWGSIESTFIADARMLKENLPHRNWQPLWYCGTRADYIYPPALRYGPALLAAALRHNTARAYHLYTAILYAIGIAVIYLFIRTGNGSRQSAWWGAAAVALFSPILLIAPEWRHDSPYHVPQRLHVLMQYGEGPHISSLALLPLVLAAGLKCFRGRSAAWSAVVAIASALVVSTNFYGATALAILFPILVWSSFSYSGDRRVLLHALAIPAMTYGLTACWLVPSYLRITSENLKLVAEPGNRWSVLVLIAAVILFVLISRKIARRLGDYRLFVCGGLFFLSLDILGHRYFHFQVAGESHRLLPELDLFIILAGVEGLRWLWQSRRAAARMGVLLVMALCFIFSVPYLRHVYSPFSADPKWQDRVEYKTPNWIHEHFPDQRTLVVGSIRFWYDTWHDLAQLDGGSQQGLLNQKLVLGEWRILHGDDPELIRLWLQAFGVDIAVVPEKRSSEIYHDIAATQVWRSAFPILRDDQEGNIFYRIPRRCPGIVRVVASERMGNLPPIPADSELVQLRAYVDAIEAGNCARLIPVNSDHFRIEADVRQGESVLLQETYDPAWHAYVEGRPVPLEKDVMEFMLLHPPAGRHVVELMFEPPLEVRAGRWLTVFSLVIAIVMIGGGVRRGSEIRTYNAGRTE